MYISFSGREDLERAPQTQTTTFLAGSYNLRDGFVIVEEESHSQRVE
jgi:hypothetical protein